MTAQPQKHSSPNSSAATQNGKVITVDENMVKAAIAGREQGTASKR
jgi:precorrin isomerase